MVKPEIIVSEFLVVHTFQISADVFRAIHEFLVISVPHPEPIVHLSLLLLNQSVKLIILANLEMV